MLLRRWSTEVQLLAKVLLRLTAYGAGTERNIYGDGWGLKKTGKGDGWGWDHEVYGSGWDGQLRYANASF